MRYEDEVKGKGKKVVGEVKESLGKPATGSWKKADSDSGLRERCKRK